MIIRRSFSSITMQYSLHHTFLGILWPKCSKGFFILRMCYYLFGIKKASIMKQKRFLRWLLPLLSSISCIPIMFLRQYRRILSTVLRSQIFRQRVQIERRPSHHWPAKAVRYHGKSASKTVFRIVRCCLKLSPYVVTTFAVFLLAFFVGMCRRAVSALGCRSPPIQSDFYIFKNSDWRK